MFERIIARAKLTFMLALFLSPVMVAAWSRSLDRVLESNLRFEPPLIESVADTSDLIAIADEL